MTNEELHCLKIALLAHGSQTHGDRPFGCHLLDVVQEVVNYGLEPHFPGITAAAMLHDTMEDTPHDQESLREASVDNDVIAMAWAVTDSTEGKNRAERKANTYAKTRELPAGVALKLCDRIANVKQCLRDGGKNFLRMYQKEQPSFREALYRAGEFDNMWADLERLLGSEPTEETRKRIEPSDPLAFRQLQPWDVNPLRPSGPVHALYEVEHTEDAEEFVKRLTRISHAVCGVLLGTGAGPSRLRYLQAPTACDDGHVIAPNGITCPDCLGAVEGAIAHTSAG